MKKTSQNDNIDGDDVDMLNECSLLTDNEYQEISDYATAVLLKKSPGNEVLTAAEKRTNEQIARNRRIIENFFEKTTGLWKIFSNRKTWAGALHDGIIFI